jgi:flagellar M-ring protein FliF
LRSPGAVRRISVAVLVDGNRSADPTTGDLVWTARTDEELASLKELVSSTVGFDEARGDIITVKSMQFQAPVIDGVVETAGAFSGFNFDIMNLIQLAVLAGVSLILGLFVVRPMLAAPPAPQRPVLLDASGLPDGAATRSSQGETAQNSGGTGGGNLALTGEIDDGPAMADGFAMLQGLDGDGFGGDLGASASPVERLRNLIADRQDETVEILRTWMEDQEEGA